MEVIGGSVITDIIELVPVEGLSRAIGFFFNPSIFSNHFSYHSSFAFCLEFYYLSLLWVIFFIFWYIISSLGGGGALIILDKYNFFWKGYGIDFLLFRSFLFLEDYL